MRIIAGKYKGRKLTPPTGQDIRPTSDRTRESVFNLLMHGHYAGDAVIEQHVVDLCCGTGAMGLEALSRGAAAATFIDKDKRSLELARANVLHCGATAQSFFLQADITALSPLPLGRPPAALVLFDAPYAAAILASAHARLKAGGWYAPEALLVAEQSRNTHTAMLEGAEQIDERNYGKAKVVVYRIL